MASSSPIAKIEIPELYGSDKTTIQVVEVEVLSPVNSEDKIRSEIHEGIEQTEEKLRAVAERIEKLNTEIDSLTNHADGFDYAVAVASGIITGLIDSFFVGEMDLKGATEKADKQIADKVKDKALKEKQDEILRKRIENAKKKGEKLSKEQIEEIKENVKRKFYSDPNNIAESGQDPVLKRAIRYLEKNHPTPQDNLYVGTGSHPASHHLDDIAHHPTLSGMVASVVIQFFRVATFVNKEGKWSFKFVGTDFKELAEMWLPIIISGVLNWLVCISEKTNEAEQKKKLPEPVLKIAHLLATAPAIIQVIKAVDNWCLHLYSDVAGSQNSKGRGAGIPGLFVSLLKEISSTPPLNFTGLPDVVNDLYTNEKFDLRAEIGLAKELSRQSVPVIVNEVLVRTFYFVRNLISEYKDHGSFDGVNWNRVVPFGNRTVERMMTIATGTFVAFDVADAAIRSGGFNAACVVRLNFVGIGRFAIAIGTDIGMGIKRNMKKGERSRALSEYINLLDVKLYYREAELWCTMADLYEKESEMHATEQVLWKNVQHNSEAMLELYAQIIKVYQYNLKAVEEMDECLDDIKTLMPGIDKMNPGLKEKMLERLK